MNYTLDYRKYAALARQAVADGQVLLENRGGVLPLKKGSKVAVFGRIQTHYYKSGTGSGGMVNVSKVIGILDALLEAEKEGCVKVYRPLLKEYRDWEKDHPFDDGTGWGQEPWCQEEMPLSDKTAAKAAAENDAAIVIIGRIAGEDRDNTADEGSYLLSRGEEEMLATVRKHFKKVIVVLNTGNIIDMKFVKEYRIDAVLYAWQGGMIGGYGTVDVLTGKVNPSGSLPDTIADDISDYPAYGNFGDPNEAVYAEDIYVGYRYFETFRQDQVIYPFGYGLSYTEFAHETTDIELKDPSKKDAALCLRVKVRNTGAVPGKEALKIFIGAPNGKLGKPARVLAAFVKTSEIPPGKKADKEYSYLFRIPVKAFASFDETGKCGLGTGWILEKGTYDVYVGRDVRSAEKAGSIKIDRDVLVEALENALSPVRPFERMTAVSSESDGSVRMVYEDAPLRKDTCKDTMTERRKKRLPKALPVTKDKGYRLVHVKSGKVSMDDYISQFSEKELLTIIRGEGMGSEQVTPGTAAAFGGISPALRKKSVPIGCMDDGPSGMRLDSGVKAFSLPNGTLLAATFDPDLSEELFGMLGIEMVKNNVDVLLGPGMNIHRYPLNGRNFEYFSEDPYLTGVMAAAQFAGLKKSHVNGTMKHFACNNQEAGRQQVDPVVSERALREIYLKGFEIAVQEGADCMMNTYCRVNGTWTSGNYDLNTTILRKQWGFQGIVMTDWWAQLSDEGGKPDKINFAAMVRSQCDLYCCVPAALADIGDNAEEALKKGELTLGELQRTAKNVCGFLMKYAPYIRQEEEELKVTVKNADKEYKKTAVKVTYLKIEKEGVIDLSKAETKKGSDHYFGVELAETGKYEVTLTGRGAFGNDLAQLPVTLFFQTNPCASFTFRGTGKWTDEKRTIFATMGKSLMHLHFGVDGIELKEIKIRFAGSWN